MKTTTTEKPQDQRDNQDNPNNHHWIECWTCIFGGTPIPPTAPVEPSPAEEEDKEDDKD